MLLDLTTVRTRDWAFAGNRFRVTSADVPPTTPVAAVVSWELLTRLVTTLLAPRTFLKCAWLPTDRHMSMAVGRRLPECAVDRRTLDGNHTIDTSCIHDLEY